MYRFIIAAVSTVVSIIIFLRYNDTPAYIAAAVCFIGGSIPFIFESIKEKITPGKIYWPVLGALTALGSFGLLTNFMVAASIPGYVMWAVLGLMLVIGMTGFYFYNPTARGLMKPIVAQSLPALDEEIEANATYSRVPKILDTSIVIDGRIIDIASTGFIEGPFIVPNFVLREIQLISDSADSIKRNRGRRGLDMLNQLRKREDLEVKIDYKDYSDTREVDAKLVKLAKEIEGKLVTNDFNLNKVAQLQGVTVLNINNLANALKPVVLPGEEMDILVVKEGKDDNQGIGYLDDGTMVVIENGGRMQNKKVKVVVTSVIQTNAGKMVFTKVVPKS